MPAAGRRRNLTKPVRRSVLLDAILAVFSQSQIPGATSLVTQHSLREDQGEPAQPVDEGTAAATASTVGEPILGASPHRPLRVLVAEDNRVTGSSSPACSRRSATR